ncbi:glycoside hydrolase family 31 protein [Nonomuraea sp. NPDC050404]|uniref:glycoside hydrolase family 31 protein n=1 Tax=Nonomuraea sp. NPDC050404 TaxID=3155783 RepID=UPI0033E6F80F
MTISRPEPALLPDELELAVEADERWWGGAAEDGLSMPYGGRRPFARDLGTPEGHGSRGAAPSNQSSPVLLSTHGRVVWSERPFAFAFEDGVLRLSGRDLQVSREGGSLRDAFLSASRRFFPPSGTAPARQLFAAPQYNTWIEHPYTPTQESVLRFARDLLAAGMPPGVVFIDDLWARDYGTWRFDRTRFPDPAGMIRQLHEWGCSVMLWVVPFVSPDSAAFRELERRGLLLRDRSGETAVRRWWNGFSAVLDLTDPAAVGWMTDRLDALVEETGVDGFKFDAGDVRDFRADDLTARPAEPVDLCEAWARVGLRYPFNEFRACWRMGGQPLGQRLQDKPPLWGPAGIGSLVPEMLAQGMIGHPFVCPDMIGGGEIGAMTGQEAIDQEFFVRYAQTAALSPMMQFSVLPSRVLDDVHLAAVRDALAVRASELPRLLALVDRAASTGEPIVRPMAYHADGLDDVTDQFFLGPDLIVAPVTVKGATERTVALPAGRWRSDDGSVVEGPVRVTVTCGLSRIPRFERLTGA